MTSHDTCTSGTYQILKVAALLRLKMEALIPAPAYCEARSVIKFLNTQSIAPIEFHRQLCHVYCHTQLDSQHMSCESSAGRCNHHPHYSPDLAPSDFDLFLHLKKFLPGQPQRFQNNRGRDECHGGSSPTGQNSKTQDIKVGSTI